MGSSATKSTSISISKSMVSIAATLFWRAVGDYSEGELGWYVGRCVALTDRGTETTRGVDEVARSLQSAQQLVFYSLKRSVAIGLSWDLLRSKENEQVKHRRVAQRRDDGVVSNG